MSRPDRSSSFSGAPDLESRRTLILELRAAMGGDDAALFAAEMLTMYLRFAERRSWSAEILDRSAVVRIEGRGVGLLEAEAGTHRVQRQPANDRAGRRHTSAVTVAVLPVAQSDIAMLDLREVDITSFRSSGAGGQNVQKTETAIRAVHRPTGLTAVIQDERSQSRNRDRALEVLAARVAERSRSGAAASRAQARREMVGAGHIAERMRTYAWRERTVTDHRTGVSQPLDRVLGGNLDAFHPG
jgi:peptide chain release factor 1